MLDGVPGELHEEPWVDFGHNRTRNIQLARGRADYLLTLDADHVLRQDAPLPRLTAGSYMLRYDGPGTQHRFKHLMRGDWLWRYEGVTHEYPCTDEPDTQENLGALVIEDRADGGCRGDKFERDARLLRRELDRDPDNPRTVFYLANTERDLGHAEEAIALYERRARMGGWGEEVYCSLLEAGVLRAERADDWPGAMDAFSRAWDGRPQRLEACYELARPACASPAAIAPRTPCSPTRSADRNPTTCSSPDPGCTDGGSSSSSRSPPTGWASSRPPSRRATDCWPCRTCPPPSANRPWPTGSSPPRTSP
ncbi:hypothetical protein ACRAWF_34680 [Streptomyces sp. L7]